MPRQGGDDRGGPKRGVIPAGPGKGKKQVVFFDAAPPVAQQGDGEDGKGNAPEAKKDGAALRALRGATKRTLSVLSIIPLAITEMFAIAGLMALGRVLVPPSESRHHAAHVSSNASGKLVCLCFLDCNGRHGD